MNLNKKSKTWLKHIPYLLHYYIGLQRRIRQSEQERPSPDILDRLVVPYSQVFRQLSEHDGQTYVDALSKNRVFWRLLDGLLEEPGGNIPKEYGIFLYSIVRCLQPVNVVETGVANGVSTSFLLQALNDNQKGHLFSFDIPNLTLLRLNRMPGWGVPPWLRSRWTLIPKSSTKCLPRLCSSLGKVDLFLHDSEHTTSTQLFEYRTVYPCLSSGGCLISDDIEDSPAFLRFAEKCKRQYHVLQFKSDTYVGILVK